MPTSTLSLTLGKEYGRSTGALARTADFSASLDEDGPTPVYSATAAWQGPPDTEGNRETLALLPSSGGLSEYQGTPPVNGLSLHSWHGETAQATFALIGVPLESWVGHRVQVHSLVHQGVNYFTHEDNYDLSFVSDPENYPLDHSPASIGAAHWHPSIDEWRRMKERLTALEVERDLRKGAAAGSS